MELRSVLRACRLIGQRMRVARPVAAFFLVVFAVGGQTPSSVKRASTDATGREVLYAATGAELARYEVDAENLTLTKRESIQLPAAVQYAWPHPSHKFFYIVWSNGGAASAPPGASSVPRGNLHGASAFRVEPSGALTLIGKTVALPARPIHTSVDISGTHLLVAYNDPSSLEVYRLNADGTIGALVPQPEKLDTGIYAHQIRAVPSNRTVILVTRGNGPTKDKPEDRGALKVFDYADGVLKNKASIAPNGGANYQPRHLDFHPTQPWVFVSLERQSKLQVYKLENGALSANPLFTKDSLAEPGHRAMRQNAGTLHVHPNGRFLYQANRSAVPNADGKAMDGGGENNIAVYSIDAQTGEPTKIQNIDTHGAEPRTFSLDPSARMLVAGNQTPMRTGSGPNAKVVPASLAVFRLRGDGKLDYIRKYDMDSSTGSLFWMGIVEAPK
jgi:6-phosphogluconolactonase